MDHHLAEPYCGTQDQELQAQLDHMMAFIGQQFDAMSSLMGSLEAGLAAAAVPGAQPGAAGLIATTAGRTMRAPTWARCEEHIAAWLDR